MKRLLVVVSVLLLTTLLARAEDLQRRSLSPDFSYPTDTRLVKVAFFDADSTLRVAPSGSVSANAADDVYLLPCVGERLREVADAGYLIAIVSNQGGVPRFISLETADKALAYTAELAREAGGEVHYFDFAEHDDEDRKPGIGMAQRLVSQLKRGYQIDMAKSFMVGDSAYKKNLDTRPDGTPGKHFSNSDRLFAENFFADFANDEVPYRFEEAAVFFGYRRNGVDVFQSEGPQRSGKVIAEEYLAAYPGRRACPQPESLVIQP
jgi:D-glycero-D-manno-heptose 1,7-bisphosphate phosphatase